MQSNMHSLLEGGGGGGCQSFAINFLKILMLLVLHCLRKFYFCLEFSVSDKEQSS